MTHGLYDQYPIIEKENAKNVLNIDSEYVVLFFGLLRPYKGASYLVRAFEALPETIRSKSTLVIAGEPWEDKEVLTLVKESPYSNKILMFSEYISDEQVPYIFSASDVLVLPYTRASQSGVAHIGISYGMPIIASKVGGLAESLDKYKGTVFVSPQDIQELAAALNDVLLNKYGIVYPLPDSLQWDNISLEWLELFQKIAP